MAVPSSNWMRKLTERKSVPEITASPKLENPFLLCPAAPPNSNPNPFPPNPWPSPNGFASSLSLIPKVTSPSRSLCLQINSLSVANYSFLCFLGLGFYVARTKDVMASAEEIKEKQTGPSIQELSLVDVPIGKVSILALSADDSLLAAIIASHVHFFAVSALLHKVWLFYTMSFQGYWLVVAHMSLHWLFLYSNCQLLSLLSYAEF